MNITRVEDQVVISAPNGQVIERLSPEDALLTASNLTSQADHILRATAKPDGE